MRTHINAMAVLVLAGLGTTALGQSPMPQAPMVLSSGTSLKKASVQLPAPTSSAQQPTANPVQPQTVPTQVAPAQVAPPQAVLPQAVHSQPVPTQVAPSAMLPSMIAPASHSEAAKPNHASNVARQAQATPAQISADKPASKLLPQPELKPPAFAPSNLFPESPKPVANKQPAQHPTRATSTLEGSSSSLLDMLTFDPANYAGAPTKEAITISYQDQAPDKNDAAKNDAAKKESNNGEASNQDDKSERKSAPYSTASMIGPLSDPLGLFSQLDITPVHGSLPGDVVRTSSVTQQPWGPDCYMWYTPTFYHRPLYFEQPNLERYGQGHYTVLQPFTSGAHFFTSIGLLPYKAITQHPREKVYTLGYQRPGNCNAWERRTVIGQSCPGEALYYWVPNSGY